MPLTFSRHAETEIAKRGLEKAWIEATVRSPDRTETDSRDVTVTRSFRAVAEMGGRVLRVAHRADHVITAFFDRGARR